MPKLNKPYRGEIWLVDWTPGRGSEQAGKRPSLIVQCDLINQHSRYDNTIVAAITTNSRPLHFHIPILPNAENGLIAPSFIQCEQLMTIACDRLESLIGCLTPDELELVDQALRRVFELR